MALLAGYRLEMLLAGHELELFRGRKSDGSEPCEILVSNVSAEFQPASGVRQLVNELSLAPVLDQPWAVRPIELIRYGARALLILEDPGGQPLYSVLKDRLPLARSLRLVIGIATALAQLHQRGLVHQNLSPANIFVCEDDCVRLTGFGFTTPPSDYTDGAPKFGLASASLEYLAPEQTGRLQAALDSRCDLYLLGLVMYEMLAGTPAFRATDPMAWLHCHIARQPDPPSTHERNVPETLDQIVLKLLAKQATDRYQSAAGVAVDVQRCLQQLESQGMIEPFRLGNSDRVTSFLLPKKLYGRATEMDCLRDGFKHVQESGDLSVVLVSGESGIGKSELIQNFSAWLTSQDALFVGTKFEQFQGEVPHGAFAQAFRHLVDELLTRSELELIEWRSSIRDALGQNAALIANLAPNLSHVIGDLPPISELPPNDVQLRFDLTIQRFLSVFALPGRPLVLFLDDLQWMDSGTLGLLERLLAAGLRNVYLIAAFREDEIAPRTVEIMLSGADRSRTRVTRLRLTALQSDHICAFLGDAMRVDPAITQPLAQVILQKSGGNPFFTRLFAEATASMGLISFDAEAGSWRWDVAKIEDQALTENVAELMVSKFDRLSTSTKLALSRLACLGTSASISLLTDVVSSSRLQIEGALDEAIEFGLITRQDDVVTFVHDRIQEAAYAQNSERELASIHLSAGQLLIAAQDESGTEERIFEVANHLNRGSTLLETAGARERLARLNLAAARRAKASTAYTAAAHYLQAAARLLGDSPWLHQYRLAFDLELAFAECEFLSGQSESAERRAMALTTRSTSLADKAAVASLRMLILTTTNEPKRAVRCALDYLLEANFDWTEFPSATAVEEEYESIGMAMGDQPIASLLDLPLMTDRNWWATMDVLVQLVPAAMLAGHRNLVDLTLLRMVNIALSYGHCDGSAYAFASLNVVLGFRFSEYHRALSFGEVGCALVERQELTRYKTGALGNFGIFVAPWTKEVSPGGLLIRRGLDTAVATGDVAYTIYCSSALISHLLTSGANLDEIYRDAVRGLHYSQKAGFDLMANVSLGELRLIQDLRGLENDQFLSLDRISTDFSFEDAIESQGDRMTFAAAACWVRKLQRSFFACDWEEGVAAADAASRHFENAPFILQIGDLHFYSALVHAKSVSSSLPHLRAAQLERLHEHHAQLSVWARSCPSNFSDKATLVLAEITRLEGSEAEAQRLYETAIQLANQNGFTQNEAIAYELAASFYEERDYVLIACTYLLRAHSLYLAWGAVGKASRLKRIYDEQVLSGRFPNASGNANGPLASFVPHVTPGLLDHSAVMKLASAVSSELVLPRLIEQLMTIAIEHACAARGILVMLDNGSAICAAEASAVAEKVDVKFPRSAVTSAALPEMVINFVVRTQATVVLDDARITNQFSSDPYFVDAQPRSVLCIPIVKQTVLCGVLYLENSLVPCAFTPNRVSVLNIIASQAAMSLENAKLYGVLEDENRDRRMAETNLRRSEALLSEAQRLTLTSSVHWIVSTGEIAWSTEGYRLMEYPLDVNPTVDLFLDRCHPDDLLHVKSSLEVSAKLGVDLDIKLRLVLPGAGVRYVRMRAHNISVAPEDYEFVGAVMDITQQQLSESALEEALNRARQSEDQLRTIISAIPTMAWRTRPDGHAEFFSQRWFDYTGLSMAQAEGYGWNVTLHPEDAAGMAELWADGLARPRSIEGEARMRRFDGEYRWLLFRATPTLDAHGNAIHWYGTNTDIEDRKRAEHAVRRSKAYLEHAQKLSHTGSFGFSVSDGGIFWSEEAARIYGYDPDLAPTAEMVLSRVHPEDRPHLDQLLAATFEGAQSLEFEQRLLMPDGSLKRVRHSLQRVASDDGVEEVLGAVTDITEHYAAKAALETALKDVQRSEEQLRAMIETAPALAWSSRQDGRADYYSNAWLTFTGLALNQLKSDGWMQVIHIEDQSTFVTRFESLIASKAEGEIEARVRRSDGLYRWFSFRAAPALDERGTVRRWYGINIDIDDQKRAETLLAAEKSLFEMISTASPMREILNKVLLVLEEVTDGLRARIVLSPAAVDHGTHGDHRSDDVSASRESLPLTRFPARIDVARGLPTLQESELYGKPISATGRVLCWSLPLMSSKKVMLGTLAIYCEEAREIAARDKGLVERLSHLASIVVERKQASDALKKREDFLAEGQRISRTGSFSWSARSGQILWSDEMYRIFDVDRTSTLSQEVVLSRIHPDDRQMALELVRSGERRNWEVECRLLLPNGDTKNLFIVAQVTSGEDDGTEVLGALMDITASKESQARLRSSLNEKDALLKEVHHRVKNNLQLISSLLSLQASRTADPNVAELFAESRNRVRSMALVHENLYRAGDFSRISMIDHIQTLCAHLRRAYALAGDHVTLTTRIDRLDLDLDRAVTVGLIINELVSNALKHAFPNGREGTIVVELKLRSTNTYCLCVTDDGVGLPTGLDSEDPGTLGLRLVRNLALQLHAFCDFTSGEGNGASFALIFENESEESIAQ